MEKTVHTSTRQRLRERDLRGIAKCRRKLARPERFELPTYSSGGCRSIQLSYGRAVVMQVYIAGRPASMVADSRAFDARHCKERA